MNDRQPQFSRITIDSPLWRENARIHVAAHNEWHRRAFPWIATLAGLSTLQFILWILS